MSDRPLNHILEDNEGLAYECARLDRECKELRQQLEQAQARVAELEAKAMQVGIDYSQAHILRKQAEAAEEAIVFALRTAGNVDPFEVNMHKFANDYAQRLRQQADDTQKEDSGDAS